MAQFKLGKFTWEDCEWLDFQAHAVGAWCLHCGGDLYLAMNRYGVYVQCVQCARKVALPYAKSA